MMPSFFPTESTLFRIPWSFNAWKMSSPVARLKARISCCQAGLILNHRGGSFETSGLGPHIWSLALLKACYLAARKKSVAEHLHRGTNRRRLTASSCSIVAAILRLTEAFSAGEYSSTSSCQTNSAAMPSRNPKGLFVNTVLSLKTGPHEPKHVLGRSAPFDGSPTKRCMGWISHSMACLRISHTYLVVSNPVLTSTRTSDHLDVGRVRSSSRQENSGHMANTSCRYMYFSACAVVNCSSASSGSKFDRLPRTGAILRRSAQAKVTG